MQMSEKEEDELNQLVARRRRTRTSAFYASTTNQSGEGGDQRSVADAVRLSTAPSTRVGAQHDESSGGSIPGGSDASLDGKIIAHSARIHQAYADTIGRRPTMEDMVVLNGRFMDRDDNDYLAVFDGHGGADTSHFCAQNLHVEFQRLLVEQGGKDVNDTAADCLKEAFLNIQRRIVSESVGGGSTGIVAFTTHDRVFIANAGDSRAIVGRVLDGARTGPVHRLSTDHKPDLPAEEERIRAAGGTVTKIAAFGGRIIARVNGVLAVSRALGDVFLQPYVTAEPEITEHELLEGEAPEAEYLIVACDGLWDVVEDDEVFDILDAAACYDDPQMAAITLRDAALDRSSSDNISVVVASLPKKSVAGSGVSGSKSDTKTPAKERSGPVRSQSGSSSWARTLFVCAAVLGGAYILWRHFA